MFFRYLGQVYILFFISFYTNAQEKNTVDIQKQIGDPYIKNYTADIYQGYTQNWGAVQDSLGVMYFANGNGVLIYDGVNWDLISLPNWNPVKSIAIDSNGKIFVGAKNEFGYLQPNIIGKLEYVSLVPKLKEEDKVFSTVWNCIATKEGTYFRTVERLYLWNDEEFKTWLPEKNTEFKNIFVVNDTIYTMLPNKGLAKLNEGKFMLVSNGRTFIGDEIHTITAFENNSLLIGTYTKGLLLYRNGERKTFETQADRFFLNNKLYTSVKLSDGTYAFGTLNNGIIILNKNGQIILQINSGEQLNSFSILDLFCDKSGLLWASLDNGIAKIEYPSVFTSYDKLKGIDTRVQKIGKFQGKILVGTSSGLFAINNDSTKQSNRFGLYQGIKDKIWDFTIFQNSLLVASRDSIFHIKDNTKLAFRYAQPSALLVSKLDANRVFITSAQGLGSLYYKNGKWTDEGKIPCVGGSVYTIVELDSGNLWLETSQSDVWNITFDNVGDAKGLKNPTCIKYGVKDGLPESYGNIYNLKDKLFFSGVSENELSIPYVKTYEFDTTTSKFIESIDLKEILNQNGNKNIGIIDIDADENVWFQTSNKGENFEFQVAWNKGNEFRVQDLNQQRIAEKYGGSQTVFYDKENNLLWITGQKKVIQQSLSFKPHSEVSFNATINNVSYQKDSIIVAGIRNSSNASLPFENNSFRFQYASPSFYDEEKNEFQYYLTDFDEDWSSWTSESQKDYTNIPEGDYTFKVRAKNIFGEVSKEDSYSFTILPPWYRTWWAYGLYGLAGILTLILFSQWRSKQLKAKNLALEKVVDQRTQEIKEKNLQLENQTEKLKELDTMKTRLFANISHEFRTPLTLIKGPVEKMEENGEEKLSMTNVKMIRRNANRLLKLVNQLLDLSKLDSGKLELNAAEGDIFKCLRAAASSFSSHAAQRDIDYQINIPSRGLWTSFDRDKLEKITYNLLSNAFKFTPDTGKITLNVNYRNERLQLTVSDNGQGIKTDKLPQIFNRFFQVDDSYTKEKAGSGIGLALTKELVDLMQGEIYVESEFEKGSVFKVVLDVAEIKSHKKQAPENYEIVQREVFETATPLIQTEKKEYQVLIIEDNNDMRYFIREQLQQDFQILEAPNGREGLKIATSKMPDLIITDLMMPQMDGVTLTKKLKTQINTSHIPVVMLTAKAGIENKLEGLETGADDYLTKPFNAKELQIRVKNLIEERKKLRELFGKKSTLNPAEVTVTSMDEQFLERVLQMLEDEHPNSEFGVPEMQTALGMSKTQLHRKLKALTDHPPGELLRNFRLKRAAQLLIQKGENVSQIAYAVGFNGLSYFTKCFKELYGVAPSEYAEKEGTDT